MVLIFGKFCSLSFLMSDAFALDVYISAEREKQNAVADVRSRLFLQLFRSCKMITISLLRRLHVCQLQLYVLILMLTLYNVFRPTQPSVPPGSVNE